MSLNIERNKARMTVWGRGWNDEVIDSGEGYTEDGLALEDFSADLNYDFGTDFDWDSLAQDLDINLDIDGNIDLTQQESLSQDLTDLANNEDAIYGYMTDHGDSDGIPARIRVTNPPDTLEYSDGDEIDFTGLVVCAYTSLTTRTPFIRQEWDGPRHNQIPFEELSFPVTTVSAGDASETAEFPEYKNSGSITVESIVSGHAVLNSLMREGGISISVPADIQRKIDNFFDTSVYGMMWYFISIWGIPTSDGVVMRFMKSPAPSIGSTRRLGRNDYAAYIREELVFYGTGNGPAAQVDRVERIDHTYYYSLMKRTTYVGHGFEPDVYYAFGTNVGASEGPGIVSVPVQWQTEYREEPYEASFEIQVT